MSRFRYTVYTAAAVILLSAALPRIIPMTGDHLFSSGYRLPYNLGEDYFLFKKYVKTVSSYNTIPVIGDSVIWGHYTTETGTLTSHLNDVQMAAEFSNLGIDGIHPAVMSGLVEHYCQALKGRKIIIGINLLWMSSARHDLSGSKNSEINHRMLLPQFTDTIPAYSPPLEERLSNVIRRSSNLLLWGDHLRLTLFRERNIYRWSMDNPLENPLLFFRPEIKEYSTPAPMDTSKSPRQSVRWIIPEESLQWRYTMKTVKLLNARGNSVLAIVTPFNRHMLTEESALQHKLIVKDIKARLASEGITAVIPEIPRAEEFADSSHLTGRGYRILAEELIKDRDFTLFIKE